MKKITLSIINILVAFSLFAQEEQNQHELTVNLGGGLSSLNYNLEQGKSKLGLGGSLGLSYTFFINDQFGIGTGIEANLYQSEYTNESLDGNYRGIDPADRNSLFRLNYTYEKDYKETQNALFLQVPLMLQFQTKGYHKFYIAAGGRAGFPVTTKFNTDASELTVSGYYDKERVTYHHLPSHGFTGYNAPETNGKLELKTAFMASLEVGMKWALNDNFSLYTGLYGDYGLNIQNTRSKRTVTYNHEGTNSQGANQDFLAFNNSVTSTAAVEKIIPMTFGVKFRLSFGLGDTKVGSAGKKFSANRYYNVDDELMTGARPGSGHAVDPQAASEQEQWQKEWLENQAVIEEALRRAEAARLLDGTNGTRIPITDSDLRILLEPLWGFNITKTVLTPEMQRVLDRKIPVLKKYSYLGIVCEGHTCDIGGDAINDKLGYERAQSVKAYLVKKGLISTRFSTISKSKHYPIVKNDSEEHRRRNRRVEFSIKK